MIDPILVAVRLLDRTGVPGILVERLAQLHRRQWDLEDACRAPEATVAAIAAAKKAIDRSNARRHHLIDLIDDGILSADVGRVLYSETVGELCDRLLILGIKIEALRASDMDVSGALANAGHLDRVAEALARDLEAGRAQLPPRLGVKIYNGRESTVEEPV